MNQDTLKKPSLDQYQTAPSREEAEAAVRTLIAWAGDNPFRSGLRETPKRVVDAYKEFFAGYHMCPATILGKRFDDLEGYRDLVLVKNIRLESHCEHHLVPIVGVAHVAYVPQKHVVGLSKLARLVEVYAKRMQVQERLTTQIADAIATHLQPKGVAVWIDAQHQCMTTRGVHKSQSATVTSSWLGCFEEHKWQQRFMASITSAV